MHNEPTVPYRPSSVNYKSPKNALPLAHSEPELKSTYKKGVEALKIYKDARILKREACVLLPKAQALIPLVSSPQLPAL